MCFLTVGDIQKGSERHFNANWEIYVDKVSCREYLVYNKGNVIQVIDYVIQLAEGTIGSPIHLLLKQNPRFDRNESL